MSFYDAIGILFFMLAGTFLLLLPLATADLLLTLLLEFLDKVKITLVEFWQSNPETPQERLQTNEPLGRF